VKGLRAWACAIAGKLACLLGLHVFPQAPVVDRPPAYWQIECSRPGCAASTFRLGFRDPSDNDPPRWMWLAVTALVTAAGILTVVVVTVII